MRNNKFHKELKEYLSLYHPELSDDENFIEERSELAQQTFIEMSRAGARIDIAIEESNAVLYSGLHFSAFQLIKDIIENEIDNNSITDRETFSMDMYIQLQPLIRSYNIDDDFERTSAYSELYNILVGVLSEKMYKYGIQ